MASGARKTDSKRWRKIPPNLVIVKRTRRFLPADPTPQVVRKVNRGAWVFKPDISLVVAADFKHGRTVVKETIAPKLDKLGTSIRLAHLKQKIEMAVCEYVVQERLHRGLHVEPCKHPLFRIKKRRYCEGSSDKGASVMRMAWFCTKCGARMREADVKAVVREMVTPKAEAFKAPRVRKARELL